MATVRVRNTEQRFITMRTRIPFRYGMSTLTAVPHVMIRVELEIDGRLGSGVAAEGLAPKWFTKNPATPYREDLEQMLAMIRKACELAEEVGPAKSIFDLWQAVYERQQRWGDAQGYAPLLWGFGVSLVERAMIDAFCRGTQTTVASAVRTNAFGIVLGELHAELAGRQPHELLPAARPTFMHVRHTIGLADPLTETEIADASRQHDGLPQALESCIDAYGLTYFKVKIGSGSEADLVRLRRVATVVMQQTGGRFAYTLDGNEQFKSVAALRAFWEEMVADAQLAPMLAHLLFLEQPLERDVALGAEAARELHAWHERPPIIIDESDATLDSLDRALACGYVGTSYKNCKGVFKGIGNACMLAQRRQEDPAKTYVLSGEDLASVGPIAMLQDLAMLAVLGVTHAERNGHHYFAGLNMWPQEVQDQVVAEHGDLYRWGDGFATLRIKHGQIGLDSIIHAPFGLKFELDARQFTLIEEWDYGLLDP